MKLTLKQLKKMIMEQVEVAASESEKNQVLRAWAWAFFQLSSNNKFTTEQVLDMLRKGPWGRGSFKVFKKEHLGRVEEIIGQNPEELLRRYIELDKQMKELKINMRKARDQIEPLVQHDED